MLDKVAAISVLPERGDVSSIDWYILDDEHNIVKCTSMMEVEAFISNPDLKRVAVDTISEVRISTVFLGLDHNYAPGPPILFETMIFGGDRDQDMYRYETWDEALEGHNNVVASHVG